MANLVAGRVALICTVASAFGFATPASAQGSSPADPNSVMTGNGSDSQIADIVVTAQRRAQSLQDVPSSLTAVTGDDLAAQGIRAIEDLGARQPNLKVAQGPAGDQLRMRGSGSGFNVGFEQSVATFVDGIYRSRSRSSRVALFDVERVEILRGPQTTFFGANAIAGALNITTRKPSARLEVNASALYSPSDGEYNVEAGISGPVADNLDMRLAGRWSGMDGFIENEDAGLKGPHLNDKQLRLSAAWAAAPNLEIEARFDIARLRDTNTFMGQLLNCPPAGGVAANQCARSVNITGETFPNELSTRSTTLSGGYFNLDMEEAAVTASLDIGGAALIATTGYLNQRSVTTSNLGAYPVPTVIGTNGYAVLNLGENLEQFSQELRFQSDDTGPLTYLVGAYFERGTLDTPTINGFYLAPFGAAFAPTYNASSKIAAQVRLNQVTTTWSGFASLTFAPVEKLKVTASLRYSHVRKTGSRIAALGTADANATYDSFVAAPDAVQNALSPVLGFSLAGFAVPERRDSEWMPSANIVYELARDVSVYASYSHGFKAGGFSFNTPDVFDPETVNAYEVGLKSRWLDRRITTNIALFRSEYSGLQDSQNIILPSGAVTTVVSNVAESRSQGVEFSGSFLLTDDLRLQADIAYLDARYIDYTNAPCPPAGVACTPDLSGRRQAFSPKWTGSAGIDYTPAVSDELKAQFGAVFYFSSAYYQQTAISALVEQPRAGKLDLRAGIGAWDDKWTLAVIAKNVTDKLTAGYRNYAPGAPGAVTALVDRPRSIALQASFNW